MNTKYWLNICNSIGDEIYKMFRKHNLKACKEIYKGAGGDKTLLIDEIAEDVILKRFKKIRKSFRMISEECGEKVFGENPEILVVVDPLDGSGNFKFGIPFSSISISIGKNTGIMKDIEFGYIKNLINGDIYHAVKGKGSYRNCKRIKLSKEGNNCLLIDIIKDREKNFKRIENIGRVFEFVRMLGSACLGICFASTGKVDGYVALGAKRTLDYAAAQLIIKEAGGIIKDINGNDLSNYKIGFNIDFDLIATSDDRMFNKIKSGIM